MEIIKEKLKEAEEAMAKQLEERQKALDERIAELDKPNKKATKK